MRKLHHNIHLLIAATWLSAALPVEEALPSPSYAPSPDSVLIEANSSYYNLLHDYADNRDFEAGASFYGIRGSLLASDEEWNFAVERVRHRIYNYENPEQLKFDIRQENVSLSAAYTKRLGGFSLNAAVSMLTNNQRLLTGSNLGFSVETGIPVISRVSAGFADYNLPGSIEASYQGAYLSFPLAIHGLVTKAGADIQIADFLTGSLEASYFSNKPYSFDDQFSYSDSTRFSSIKANIVYRAENWRLSGAFQQMSCDNSPDFYYGGTNYGHLNLSDAVYRNLELDLCSVGRAGKESSLDWGFISLKGRMVGNVQSWPFVDLLATLIENRLNYRISGQLNMWYLRASRRIDLGMLTLEPRLSYFDIRPSLSVESWQPEFLVFGFKNYSNSSLELERAGLGLFEASAVVHLPVAVVKVSGGQFVPLFSRKRTVYEGPPGGPGPVPAAASGGSTGGGRWISVSFLKYFN